MKFKISSLILQRGEEPEVVFDCDAGTTTLVEASVNDDKAFSGIFLLATEELPPVMFMVTVGKGSESDFIRTACMWNDQDNAKAKEGYMPTKFQVGFDLSLVDKIALGNSGIPAPFTGDSVMHAFRRGVIEYEVA